MTKQDFLEAFGFIFAQEFAKAAPKKTGKLARSFPGTSRVENGIIKYTLPLYAEFVEFGTAPHVITPKNKKALSFKIGGKDILVKKVNHPGTRPNPFIRDTFNRQTQEVLKRTINFLNSK